MSFSFSIQIGFHEVDPAGIVFFSRYFEYAHRAYEAWMRSEGFDFLAIVPDEPIALPLVHAEADFKSPARYGDELTLSLSPARIGKSSYTLHHDLTAADGEQRTRIQTVHVCVDSSSFQSRPLPESLRASLERLKSDR